MTKTQDNVDDKRLCTHSSCVLYYVVSNILHWFGCEPSKEEEARTQNIRLYARYEARYVDVDDDDDNNDARVDEKQSMRTLARAKWRNSSIQRQRSFSLLSLSRPLSPTLSFACFTFLGKSLNFIGYTNVRTITTAAAVVVVVVDDVVRLGIILFTCDVFAFGCVSSCVCVYLYGSRYTKRRDIFVLLLRHRCRCRCHCRLCRRLILR